MTKVSKALIILPGDRTNKINFPFSLWVFKCILWWQSIVYFWKSCVAERKANRSNDTEMLTNGGPGDGFICTMMPGRLDCKGSSTWMHILTTANVIGNININCMTVMHHHILHHDSVHVITDVLLFRKHLFCGEMYCILMCLSLRLQNAVENNYPSHIGWGALHHRRDQKAPTPGIHPIPTQDQREPVLRASSPAIAAEARGAVLQPRGPCGHRAPLPPQRLVQDPTPPSDDQRGGLPQPHCGQPFLLWPV